MVLFAAPRKEQERRTIEREIKVDRNYEIGAIKEQRQGEKGPKVWPFFHLQPQRRGGSVPSVSSLVGQLLDCHCFAFHRQAFKCEQGCIVSFRLLCNAKDKICSTSLAKAV